MKAAFPLQAALLLFTLSFIAACKDDDDGACGLPENTIVRSVETASPATAYAVYSGTLTNNGEDIIFYSYNGTRVTFFIGMNVSGICTENHFHPKFKVTTSGDAVSESAKIYFEAYWSLLFPGEDYVAVDGALQGNHNYLGSLECGLKQVFQDEPANIDLYANVQFDGVGDINSDKETLQEIIISLEIICTYDQDI